MCANQIIRHGSVEQFADVLEMSDGEPLRGGRIADIYAALDSRLAKLKKSKKRKEAREVEKMQKMFAESADQWGNN